MGGRESRCNWRGLPFTFTLGFLFALAPPIAQSRTLRFVTLLYRHGDRSPVKTYPRDPYQESAWPQGFGQLSQIMIKTFFLTIGVLLSQIRKNLTLATKDSAPHHVKMLMYSAHDTTLAALQTALNVYNGKQPPYASCHIFELYQEDDGNFTVEMFFRNESHKEPYVLLLPDCKQRCPLQQFLQLTEPVISQDWKQECQIISTWNNTELIVTLAVSGSLLFLLIVLLMTVLIRVKSQPLGYSHISNEGEEQP
ncbi:PREDICTED: lysosomal acid phosphatase [Thamnophis sirtalis]|uniref:Lysosomal acid phosphatase n=1 Tax=Thamnophis sirtalis TaxID=35019 RepID=A0A6I9YP61_9SAUR|nr:PREDICTED: lysosomal acid phosphatase [Thamnophis sirtalis]